MHRRLLATSIAAIAAISLTACAAEPAEKASSSSASSTSSSGTGSATSSDSATPSSSAGSSDPAAASSAADASVSPTASDAPFTADTNPDTSTASPDAALVLTAVRTGTQAGFDRVVLEFSGPGTPGWQAQYADSASRQGKGDPITPGGTAILDITVSGSAIPKEGQATVPAGQIAGPGAAVQGVYVDGTFEGVTHVVLGTGAKKAFRVFAESNPPRVVIDVQH